MSAATRTLSKSDFTLARTCDAKLYFRENGYPDNSGNNPYVRLLWQGGYMVDALAKARYPAGVQLDYGRDPEAECRRTLELLAQDEVTLFEGTLLAGRRLARADVIDKRDGRIRLIETKSKKINGAEHLASLADGGKGVFRAKRRPHGILADWRKYIEDVAYQTILLERLLPGATVQPFLALVDGAKRSSANGVPRLFQLDHVEGRDGTQRLRSARFTGTPDDRSGLDLLIEIDVSEEVAIVRDEVESAAAHFEAHLDAPLTTFVTGLTRGSKCGDCEFRVDADVSRNGFADCWGALAGVQPHILDLYYVGMARTPDRAALVDWMLGQGTASLLDVPLEGLRKADGTVGPVAARQILQIEHTRRNEPHLGAGLKRKVDALQYPLHYIDFETSRLALPYHAGMRPYGLVTFQWSCHRVDAPGNAPVHTEWLNDVDVWPNQTFAESLRACLGDSGPVLTWSHYEASVLKDIVRDLAEFGRNDPALVKWAEEVFERRIVDLHVWAKEDFWHPGMAGRTSIKVVLDSLWRADPAMREQFREWTGLAPDANRDPYASLPPVAINGVLQDVHEGSGAMTAYQEMMYGLSAGDPAARAGWAALLRRYCALDTLAMVLIVEHWRRATR